MEFNETLFDNTTSVNDIYDGIEIEKLDVPKWSYRIVGVVLLFVGIFGVLENLLVLRIFYVSKQLRSPTNIFIIGLAISDLSMAGLANPLATSSALYGDWFAGEFMCYWEGFLVYFLGLSELYILTAISVDRFIVIAKPLRSSIITKRFAVLSVVGCFACGALWSIFPFFGWSSYGLEASGIFCGLLWEDRGISNTTYILSIFVFCFIIPMGIMIYCYFQIYMTIRTMNKSTKFDKASRVAKRNLKVERKMLKSCVVMCGVFWCCWFPYAIVSFIQAFGDPHSIPVILTTIPSAAAKSEVVWNPIIYVATNKQFRQALYANLPCTGLRESLVKREEAQEATQTSKDSELDNKTVTQSNQVASSAETNVDKTKVQTVSINVASKTDAGPTSVDC